MLRSSANARRIGIGLVTLTTLSFAVLDTTAKWLVLQLPVLQVVWLRFLAHSAQNCAPGALASSQQVMQRGSFIWPPASLSAQS